MLTREKGQIEIRPSRGNERRSRCHVACHYVDEKTTDFFNQESRVTGV
jgi:hypothetical protein